MTHKFQVGDKVRVTQNAPLHVSLVRGRPRRIIAIEHTRHRALYILGSNGRGECAGEPASDGYRNYKFNSYQLDRYCPRSYKGHQHRGNGKQ